MSQKNSAPRIKFTGTRDGENDVYVTLDSAGWENAKSRRYDPTALWNTINGNRLNHRIFRVSTDHPFSRKSMLQQYLGLVPDNSSYRGTPALRHPFMRTMALRFGMAMESVKLSSQRQVGKSNMIYAQLTQFHNHYLSELDWIKASKPVPVDLTRYLKLLTGKDVWNPMPVWLRDVPPYFQPDDVMRAGVGKSLLYNMMPSVKLHLKSVRGVFRGMPYFFNDEFKRGPAGFWPDTIEYGMASGGPAMTAQLNRERLVKPKKGKA